MAMRRDPNGEYVLVSDAQKECRNAAIRGLWVGWFIVVSLVVSISCAIYLESPRDAEVLWEDLTAAAQRYADRD